MDYEKKYNEALERARELRDKALAYNANHYVKDYELIFPELRESEDERLRKAALEGIEYLERKLGWDAIGDTDILDVKEYLEKQKEQKPAEWSEEDETAFGDLMWCIERARKSAKDENDMGNIWYAENWVKNRLKFIRPSWKPSEQEKGALRTAIYILDKERNSPRAAAHLQNILNTFKDEESRNDWKPSEEQMKALQRAVNKLAKTDVADSVRLSIMYDNLKKLW